MTAFIEIEDATDLGRCQYGRFDPVDLDGPAPAPREGFSYYPLTEAIDWRARPSVSHVVKWNAGAWEWVDSESIADKQARAIAEIDIFGDACRLAVVGDAARIKEYERALAGAQSYRDAGYTGPVPRAVSAWSNAKWRDGWTPQQAAEDILAANTRWIDALEGIRDLRLAVKEDIRAAATGQEVATTVETFRTTLTAAMQGVQ